MKKTIAILLVLVLAGVGLFAADSLLQTTGANGVQTTPTATATTEATMTLKTSVVGYVIFGLSGTSLGAADTAAPYQSYEAFEEAVYTNIANTFDSLTSLSSTPTLGYFSGFNSTRTAVGITVTLKPLVNDEEDTAIVPVTYNIGGTDVLVNSASFGSTTLSIPPAIATRGILLSQEVTVNVTEADVDLAPAGNYTSTIVFTVTGA